MMNSSKSMFDVEALRKRMKRPNISDPSILRIEDRRWVQEFLDDQITYHEFLEKLGMTRNEITAAIPGFFNPTFSQFDVMHPGDIRPLPKDIARRFINVNNPKINKLLIKFNLAFNLGTNITNKLVDQIYNPKVISIKDLFTDYLWFIQNNSDELNFIDTYEMRVIRRKIAAALDKKHVLSGENSVGIDELIGVINTDEIAKVMQSPIYGNQGEIDLILDAVLADQLTAKLRQINEAFNERSRSKAIKMQIDLLKDLQDISPTSIAVLPRTGAILESIRFITSIYSAPSVTVPGVKEGRESDDQFDVYLKHLDQLTFPVNTIRRDELKKYASNLNSIFPPRHRFVELLLNDDVASQPELIELFGETILRDADRTSIELPDSIKKALLESSHTSFAQELGIPLNYALRFTQIL